MGKIKINTVASLLKSFTSQDEGTNKTLSRTSVFTTARRKERLVGCRLKASEAVFSPRLGPGLWNCPMHPVGLLGYLGGTWEMMTSSSSASVIPGSRGGHLDTMGLPALLLLLLLQEEELWNFLCMHQNTDLAHKTGKKTE